MADTEKTPFDAIIEKVAITSDRYRFEVDLHRVILEINIFEHVDKPFLTGSILFNDNANLYNQINWLGTEKVEISIRTQEGTGSSRLQINKKFRVVNVEKAAKGNDENEIFSINIVEESAYISKVKRVQQSYEGHHQEIIQQILQDHLNKQLLFEQNKTDGFEKIRVIVPNLTPLEAANWVKDAIPDAFGSPYYLYASIADDKLRLIDLETVLEPKTAALNSKDQPYTLSQAYGSNEAVKRDEIEQSFVIQEYRTESVDNTLKLVQGGFIGATWNFFDPLKGDQYVINHDISETFRKMIARNTLPPYQKDPIFDEEVIIDDKKMHEISSREINLIATSRVYEDWEEFKSIREDDEQPLHENKIIQKALRHLLLKSPIDINVPGKNFLMKDRNVSIANKIHIRFETFDNDTGVRTIVRDDKRSGEYFIYAARHRFQQNNYSVNLKCAKLAQGTEIEKVGVIR